MKNNNCKILRYEGKETMHVRDKQSKGLHAI